MGAQQMKYYNERLTPHADKQRYLSLKRIKDDAISQQVDRETVMCNQSITSVSSPKRGITVADFAKIKIEPPYFDEFSKAETFRNDLKIQDENIFIKQEEVSEKISSISIVGDQENCMEFETVSRTSVELNQALIPTHAAISTKTVIQNNACLSLHEKTNEKISFDIQSIIKSEVSDEYKYFESSENKAENHKLREILTEPGGGRDVFENTNSTKLVKNPLAFLKKNCSKVRNEERCLNNTIKSEDILINEESEVSTSFKSAIKVESDLPTIILSELTIKSEDFNICENNEKILQNTNLYQTCLSCNLDSSLDVNLSHENINSDESLSYLKYFSTYEISSEEENDIPFHNVQSNQNIKIRRKRKPYKKNLNKDSNKVNKKLNFHVKRQETRPKSKRLVKPRTKKYRKKKFNEKDSSFISGLKSKNLLKNLPKIGIKTRRRLKKSTAKKGSVGKSQTEFPKPFKMDHETAQKYQTARVELPKPMMFKSEFALKSKKKQLYLKPEFQPFVRLKRLKSEELLVPLKTKHSRRTRNFKDTSETGRDFLIKQAYSLNPDIKCNRLSMDCDNSHYYEQRLLNSRSDRSCSALTDIPTESLDEMETKYFSPRERFSIFQASTPDGASMFSGAIDSGLSTSTPSTPHCSQQNVNKTLLLKIAAERAFINNHLIQFGYSPIQFDLYNNLNELTVFLKFLIGNTMYDN